MIMRRGPPRPHRLAHVRFFDGKWKFRRFWYSKVISIFMRYLLLHSKRVPKNRTLQTRSHFSVSPPDFLHLFSNISVNISSNQLCFKWQLIGTFLQMLTKFHQNWSIPCIDCRQFRKITFPRKNYAKDLCSMIKQIISWNDQSPNLLEWTFGFHLNPKKQCWEIPVTMKSSFKEMCVFFSPILEREIAMGANKIATN